MAISDNYAPDVSLCDGVTTAFSGDWNVLAAAYFRFAIENVSSGVQTLLIQGTDYTLWFNDNGYIATTAVAYSASYKAVRYREVALDQSAPYTTSKGFQGKAVENSFDKLTAIEQDQNDNIGRSFKAPVGESAVALLPTATTRALKYLAFDASGAPIAAEGTTDTPISAAMEPVVSAATLAGARTELEVYSTTEVYSKAEVDGLLAPSAKNKIINGNFGINDWAYVSGAAIAASAFGHNRWKAGTSGCTYTFTQAKASTTITITAGSLIQTIEDANVEGGTYTLSWTGTATAKVNGGTAAASPITVTGLAADTAITVELLTGTVGLVQVETGDTATDFERRSITTEELLCARYLPVFVSTGTSSLVGVGTVNSSTAGQPLIFFKVPSRVAPTGLTVSAVTHFSVNIATGNVACTNVTIGGMTGRNAVMLNFYVSSGLTAGQSCFGFANNASGRLLLTGCEL